MPWLIGILLAGTALAADRKVDPRRAFARPRLPERGRPRPGGRSGQGTGDSTGRTACSTRKSPRPR
ncbi:MAG: hypothetical protein M0C28_26925 [Candidatus Moduliflexus flocculans]|nr:hypothetical protein [Candidatus Moduliflexus flocculans]